MTRLDLWKAQLKAARAILKIHRKEANAAVRTLYRTSNLITKLEEKIGNHLAKTER